MIYYIESVSQVPNTIITELDFEFPKLFEIEMNVYLEMN